MRLRYPGVSLPCDRCNNCRGVMSQRTTSYFRTWSRSSTRVEGMIFPPSRTRCADNALVMACAPPRGIGQPTACAAAPNTMPKDALSGSFRLKNECAARPANNARVRSLRNLRRATKVAGGSASWAKFANKNGWVGNRSNGRSTSFANAGQFFASGAIRFRQARPSSCSTRSASFRFRSNVIAAAIVEGMRQRCRRINPLEAIVRERQRIEERRSDGHGMHGRAKVVVESRKRQFHGACAAARLGFRLEYVHAQTGLRQHNRSRQPVGACANHACFLVPNVAIALAHTLNSTAAEPSCLGHFLAPWQFFRPGQSSMWEHRRPAAADATSFQWHVSRRES